MTADELDREYARQLTAMAAARVEHEPAAFVADGPRDPAMPRRRDSGARARGGDPDLGRTSTSTTNGYGARPNGPGRRSSR